jgi:hypothetical protein
VLGPVVVVRIAGQPREHNASFGIGYRRVSPLAFGCATMLMSQRGFDTAIGSQAGCSFTGESVEGEGGGTWQLLAFAGWGNRLGVGFKRFSGIMLVGVDQGGSPVVVPAQCTATPTTAVGASSVDWQQNHGYVIEL